MNPTFANIYSHAYLAPLWQESGGNNTLLGLLLAVGALILLIVFWQWWQYVEGEADERDVRMTDVVTVQAHEAAARPASSTARFALEFVPTAEANRIPPAPLTAPTAVAAAEPELEEESEPAAPEDTTEAEDPAVAGTAMSALPAEDELAPESAPVTPDNLAKIEGIGPKISQLLQEAGIQTFAQLAAADVEQIKGILEAAGSRYKLADPATWPQQAALAAAGKWEELQALQDELSGGRSS